MSLTVLTKITENKLNEIDIENDLHSVLREMDNEKVTEAKNRSVIINRSIKT